jgi:methionyl-tRNA formyltransferase
MKYIFFGTDTFSVAIVEKLISDFFFPSAIVTMPDRPVGRKQIMTPPAMKDVCLHHDIPCLQPENPDELLEQLKTYDADVFIVASYGKIISDAVLSIPKQGCINVHTSLLPAYRGPSPIQQVILDQQEQTGITIMKMDAKMDHGPLYFQKAIDIASNETYRSLHSKLAHIGADVLPKVLPDIMKGNLKAKEQDHSAATVTKIIKKDDARINWEQPSDVIDAHIRAYYDWPIAWTLLEDDKRLKIIQASLSAHSSENKEPGQLFFLDGGVFITTKKGALEIHSLQVEGKKVMTPKNFIDGFHRFDGTKLS